MNAKREELTEGERRYLEHVRRARSQGMGLSQYCRCVGLNPFSLYSMRRQMRRKGILAPVQQSAKAAGAKERRGSAVPAAGASAPAGLVCRVRHPSGWTIECGSWPEPRWLAGVTARSIRSFPGRSWNGQHTSSTQYERYVMRTLNMNEVEQVAAGLFKWEDLFGGGGGGSWSEDWGGFSGAAGALSGTLWGAAWGVGEAGLAAETVPGLGTAVGGTLIAGAAIMGMAAGISYGISNI